MNKEDTKKYLQMLGHELQEQQVLGQILVADGTVMFLDVRKPQGREDINTYMAYLRGDGPPVERHRNIDTYFGGHGAAIREAASAIATREGLPAGWLHDALKDFFCTQPPHEKWLEYPGLRVFLAPTDYVLAMKIATLDCPQDSEDIKLLAGKLGIANTQDMLTHVAKYVPKQLLTPEMRLCIKQCFEPKRRVSEKAGH